MRSVLEGCDRATREMLALHFAAGLTVAETAAVVGKSEAAVKKHLTRTVRALKEQYHGATG
jgi:DNA-directed RNA polymerase specialized sigma24 family protein